MGHDHFGFGGFGRHGHGGGRGGFFGRFGGGGPGGFMGAGLRAAKMFAAGDLQLIILSLLSEKPRHGYDIIKALEEHSSGLYTPSPGMVYPALTYLEEAGYAVSEADGNKKLFKITPEGSDHFAKNKSTADEALSNLALFGQKMAKVREQMASDEAESAEDERWAGNPRDQAKKEWRHMKMELHEIKHELKAAIFEKLGASTEEKKRVLDVLRKAIAEIRKH
jgi:DNA-binding PadR family transcriptional regulator